MHPWKSRWGKMSQLGMLQMTAVSTTGQEQTQQSIHLGQRKAQNQVSNFYPALHGVARQCSVVSGLQTFRPFIGNQMLDGLQQYLQSAGQTMSSCHGKTVSIFVWLAPFLLCHYRRDKIFFLSFLCLPCSCIGSSKSSRSKYGLCMPCLNACLRSTVVGPVAMTSAFSRPSNLSFCALTPSKLLVIQ